MIRIFLVQRVYQWPIAVHRLPKDIFHLPRALKPLMYKRLSHLCPQTLLGMRGFKMAVNNILLNRMHHVVQLHVSQPVSDIISTHPKILPPSPCCRLKITGNRLVVLGFHISIADIYIDCIAVIESIFPIRRIGSIGKTKRDLHIIDPSQPRRTILSGIFITR